MERNGHGGDDVERSTGLGIRWMAATWKRRGGGGGGGQEVDRADWEWGGMGWEATPSCLSRISALVLECSSFCRCQKVLTEKPRIAIEIFRNNSRLTRCDRDERGIARDW